MRNSLEPINKSLNAGIKNWQRTTRKTPASAQNVTIVDCFKPFILSFYQKIAFWRFFIGRTMLKAG